MAERAATATIDAPADGDDGTDVLHDVLAAFAEANDHRTMSRDEFLGARFDAGLAWVSFPRGYGGRGWNRRLQRDVERWFAAQCAPSPSDFSPIAFGSIGPTVMVHGTDEQRARYLRPMFVGSDTWCQLQSEPGAGSDLAAVAMRAERDGDGWRLNGQKVWTSVAHTANLGFLIARTDPDAPKHAGLSCFVVDMRAAGIDVCALRQITGEAEFNEVFFDDVWVDDRDRVGELNGGWAVLHTVLSSEREVLGEGVAISVVPQMLADLVERARELAGRLTVGEWAVVRESLMGEYARARVLDLTQRRSAVLEQASGTGLPPSLLKILHSQVAQGMSAALVNAIGADGLLYPKTYAMDRPEHLNRYENAQYFFLRSRSHTIGGGTSEIHKNLLGGKSLGLPSEPR